MSVWTAKVSNLNKEYIVLKHKLRGINYVVQGIKFRDGYAVVEKDSKTYHMLKKMPILQGCQEYPLIYLRKLKFVTKALDVKMVYGPDVYRHYLECFNKEVSTEQSDKKLQDEITHLDSGLCAYRVLRGGLCLREAITGSPSQYCHLHILEDPRLADYGIKIPKYITKQETPALKDKVIKQLSKSKEAPTNGKDVGVKQEE